MARVASMARWPAAARTAYQVTLTQLEAAISSADPEQRRLLDSVRRAVCRDRGSIRASDAELASLLAAHAVTRPGALAVLPSLEGSPRWQALDACLRSLLAGPVDTRAAIKHAKEAPAG